MSESMKITSLTDLEKVQAEGRASLFPAEDVKITVGEASCGISTGAGKVHRALVEEKEKTDSATVIAATGCLGFCQREPLMDIYQPGRGRIVFRQMSPEVAVRMLNEPDNDKLMRRWVLGRIEDEYNLIQDYVHQYDESDQSDIVRKFPSLKEVGFFKSQMKIAMRHCGLIDPFDIKHYMAMGGYRPLIKALLDMEPGQVIDEMLASGLRGRGGGGFPAGRKWASCRKSAGDLKYVICNADEGDPGAYMDRSVLEGDPHSVIEGMIIGAFAIGASEGYIYCRNEYPLAVKTLNHALAQAREYGLLGQNILGTGFDFDMIVTRGGGAFVCGESTALMASLEGKIGEPRGKHIHTVEKGLWYRPSNLNNVETWANVPAIIARGGDWYAFIGTAGSKGTKVFSLVGKVNNTGLVEVPMGTTLRQIIFEAGGGVAAGKQFKAVQTGGPSGGCIPASLLDLPIDYEQLKATGSIMGSGGMIVMDEEDCMVDIAKYFLAFLEEESCGKCVPCRLGVKRMREVLTAICEGHGREGDIERLEALGTTLTEAALCGLGKTAANPVLSTIKYFRDEYEAHIRDKQCPAGKCPNLTPAPCQRTCPAGIDVPSYVSLVGHGRFAEAIDLIREDNPLVAVCGRVCSHPCQQYCTRGEVDDPIQIMRLKRWIADRTAEGAYQTRIKAAPLTEAPVAVVGSGPAGLSCAYFLARQGHPVTIFEAQDVAGGMLGWGLPEYRLPKAALQQDLDFITSFGVEIKTGVRFGEDIKLDDLRDQGYKAFFLGVGAMRSFRMGLPGELETKGIWDCLSFLKSVNEGQPVEVGRRILVIGGGNAAVDAARTAIRLTYRHASEGETCRICGRPVHLHPDHPMLKQDEATEVTMVYRRSRDEMPAFPYEIDAAEDEGVKFILQALPARIERDGNRVKGLVCLRTELGRPDTSGRRRPVPVAGSEFLVPADTVITAIGQTVHIEPWVDWEGFIITDRQLFHVDPTTYQSSVPDVFAGGDAVTGAATVIEAVAAGKAAARNMHRYLTDQPLETLKRMPTARRIVPLLEVTDEEKETLEVPAIPELEVHQRVSSFDEAHLGYGDQIARNEAKRCLRCDLNK
jgi:NADH-quinone oxidoreductase subunit F